MSSEVVMPRNFDVRQIGIGQVKQLSTGGKAMYIGYAGQQQFCLQTPSMKAPFGLSMWPSDNGGPDKYSIDLSFDGRESREALQVFYDALQAIDKRMVLDAMENSQSWFKKKYPSVDVVEALYTPTVKFAKDRATGEINTNFEPTFKMSLPFKDGRFQCPAFGSRREEIDLNEVLQSGRSKGARVQAIVQLCSVWIVGSKFGLTWKVRQLKIEEPVRLTGYAFKATEEDAEVDEVEDAVVVVRRTNTNANANANMMEESDEEGAPQRDE